MDKVVAELIRVAKEIQADSDIVVAAVDDGKMDKKQDSLDKAKDKGRDVLKLIFGWVVKRDINFAEFKYLIERNT